MRKFIIAALACIALCGASSASAQFRYGPMAGVDMTNLHFKQSDILNVDKSVGYSAGLVAEMMFPGIGFGLDLGLYYEQRGATLDMGQKLLWSSQGLGRERSYLHYAVVPLHIRFKYTRLNGFEEKLAPIVYAGPSFGFLVGHSKNPALEYAGGDMGVEFGLGAEIMQHWQLTASYNMGMTYALKAKVLTNFSARNRTWNIRLAYLF
ncbi:MAG: PorT family protein [Bacteroides sp.]|nr:PorT family protein [Bacteroides sp.]